MSNTYLFFLAFHYSVWSSVLLRPQINPPDVFSEIPTWRVACIHAKCDYNPPQKKKYLHHKNKLSSAII